MKKINIPEKYYEIWIKALPYLKKCRTGELEHSKEIAEEIFKLSKNKKIDLDFLIPVAILHDVGHSMILPEHFKYITGPKKEENSKLVHMLIGAKIAHDILKKINYSNEKIKKIVEFIRIHDKKDKSLFKSKEEKIFYDLDRLDRLTDKGFKIAENEFGLKRKEVIEMFEKHVLNGLILKENIKIAEERIKNLKEKYL